jgi:hypothetical protein
MKKYLKNQIEMKNVNLIVLEEKLTKAKIYQKDISRNVTELTRVVKDSKNAKLAKLLLQKSLDMQTQANESIIEIQTQNTSAKNPEFSYDDTAKLLVDFQKSVDLLNTKKNRTSAYINNSKSYSLTADNKEA